MTAVGQPMGIVTRWLVCCVCVCLFALPQACSDQRPIIDGGQTRFDSSADALRFEPAVISAFGNSPVAIYQNTFVLNENEPPQVELAGRPCLDVEIISERVLGCIPQGSPASGPGWLLLTQDGDSLREFGGFEIAVPRERRLDRLAAIGGRLAAGYSGGGFTAALQRQSVAAFVARQAGTYFAMPFVTEGLPPVPTLADMDAVTTRLPADWDDAAFDKLSDVTSLRADPEIHLHNLACPFAATAGEIVGTEPINVQGGRYRELLFGADAPGSAVIQRLADLSPDAVLIGWESWDFANNLDDGRTLVAEAIEGEITALFDAILTVTPDALIVVLNLPPQNWTPLTAYSEWRRYETIWIDNALNVAATRARARYGRADIIIVDAFAFFSAVAHAKGRFTRFDQDWEFTLGENGEADALVSDANGELQSIGFDAFEGLFGFDHATLTPTGNAIVANLVIEALNARSGADVSDPLLNQPLPYVAVAEVLAHDPYSPAAVARMRETTAFVQPESLADAAVLPPLHTAHRCAIGFGDGDSPEPGDCPQTLFVNNGQPLSFVNGESGTIVVEVAGFNGKPLGGYPVAGFVRDGSLQSDLATTDENGRATFVYQAPLTPSYDSFSVVCGEQLLRLSVAIGGDK